MENRSTILNELKEVSPALAGMLIFHPYTVPNGYFEELAARVLERIRQQQDVLPAVLQPTIAQPYTVPAGYFDSLATQILQRIKAEEVVPAILQRANSNPYTVPAGYFNTLADNLLQRVKAGEAATAAEELSLLSPLLSKLDKKTPFSTPAGYFNELKEQTLAGMPTSEGQENLSPLLAGLQNKQVYKVPAGYFDNLPAQLVQQVKAPATAKVVSISFTRVVTYAVAACVAGIIAVSSWFYMGKSSTSSVTDDKVLLAQTEAKMATISDDVLEQYINNQQAVVATETPTITTSADIKAADVKDLLADVSDAELQKYLDQYAINKQSLIN